MRLPELIHLSGHSASTVIRRLARMLHDRPLSSERLFDHTEALAWIARHRGERAPRIDVTTRENT